MKLITTYNRIIIFFIILLAAIYLSFRIFDYRVEYATKFDPKLWEEKYNKSQWVVPNSKQPIGDDGLYMHAGWQYIHGKDPSLLNAELPPLGKYLIGVGEIGFGNAAIFGLLSALLVLSGFYLINTLLFTNRILSFIPVALFSLEPLFWTQIRAPFLDLFYLGLFCYCSYFFLKKQFIISAVFFGLMASTKATSATFLLVTGVSIVYLLFSGNKKLLRVYGLSLFVALTIFLLTYARYFLLGHTLKDFLALQKWIIMFYASGAKGTFSAPWEIIFTGAYHNWWHARSMVHEWHVGWVLIPFITFFALFNIFRQKIKKPISFFIFWVIAYLLFLSTVPVWSHYFLMILPFVYTIALWLVVRNYGKNY